MCSLALRCQVQQEVYSLLWLIDAKGSHVLTVHDHEQMPTSGRPVLPAWYPASTMLHCARASLMSRPDGQDCAHTSTRQSTASWLPSGNHCHSLCNACSLCAAPQQPQLVAPRASSIPDNLCPPCSAAGRAAAGSRGWCTACTSARLGSTCSVPQGIAQHHCRGAEIQASALHVNTLCRAVVIRVLCSC